MKKEEERDYFKVVDSIVMLVFIIACCIFGLLFSHESKAEQLDVNFGSWSYHGDRTKEYNEENWLIGTTLGEYSLAYYKNSNGGDTVIAAKNFLWPVTSNLSAGYMLGAATGYTKGGEPMLAGMFKVRYDIGDWSIHYHMLPSKEWDKPTVQQIHFSYALSRSVKPYEPDKDKRWALGYGYGLGGTAELTYSLRDNLSIRAKVVNGKFKWDDVWSWSEYGNEVQLWQEEFVHISNYGVMLDYHPFKGDFTLYSGLLYNGNEYKTTYHAYNTLGPEACGKVNLYHEPVTVCGGDKLYGVVDFDRLSLAAGVRWGNPFLRTGWSWFVDVGIHTMSGINGRANYVGGGNVTQAGLDRWVNDKEKPKYEDKLSLAPILTFGFQF